MMCAIDRPPRTAIFDMGRTLS